LVFDINFNYMDDIPFYKRPWFYIAGWLAFLLLVYGAQIYRMGGVRASIFDIFLDLICVFPLLLVLWMAFFAQFVLPVQTFRDRQKIFSRLLARLSGGHGPALFIENGVIKEHSGERLKKGPGVVWLDSASAALTRTPVAIKQTIGPGVHFIESNEYIAGTLDLHIQSHFIGPRELDKPFDEKSESQTAEEYNQIQDRRKQVSALTRDGIEIIPRISVVFRVDTGFPKAGQPGSRFGYRKGVTKKAKEQEEKDKDAIRRAILGEGINPMAEPESPRHRVAWNQLPVSLAVDVWREYVAKFTLDELFLPNQVVSPPVPQMPEPTEEEIDLLSQPIRVGANRETVQNVFASMLREINLFMWRTLKALDENTEDQTKKDLPAWPAVTSVQKSESDEAQKKTALQLINDMVKARLTQAEVDILDDHGVRGEGTIPSAEFNLLQERGLKVLNVSINGLVLDPRIDETIISRWSTTWLKNARNESEQIERKRNIIESAAREQAIRQYADMLSRDLIQKKPDGIKDTLRTLLMRTRSIIFNNDQLRRRMTTEEEHLEEIIKWIEVEDS
jgi:hypothetical protein